MQDSLKLDIQPVVERAERIAAHVERELPAHTGLAAAARGVAHAAHQAEQCSRKLRRPFGVHRLPATFLLVALGIFAVWIYWHFFRTSELVIALSSRDAVQLRGSVDRRVRFVPLETDGSAQSVAKLLNGEADLAFVQGGIEIPAHLLKTDLESVELVLMFMREDRLSPRSVRTIMTSSEGQGSHTMAQIFARAWGIDNLVRYQHDWRAFTDDPQFEIDEDVDAIFVVKDPMSGTIERAAKRIRDAGFQLVPPDLGAWSLRLPFLSETEVRSGYLDPIAVIPEQTISTYAVDTYLVARPHLSARGLANAERSLRIRTVFDTSDVQPTIDAANEVIQGVEAALGILVYIGIAFLALLGMDIVAYRRRFNELNSLVSLISMHQSSKDVISGSKQYRSRHVAYLGVCSDLLGLIAVITGYYTQENSSLLYNRLLEIIHERCSGLKINIQLKILHALVDLPIPSSQDGADLATEMVQVPATNEQGPAPIDASPGAKPA